MTAVTDVGGDCPATATVQLDGWLCRAICNLEAGHPGAEHEDLVLGTWTEPLAEHQDAPPGAAG